MPSWNFITNHGAVLIIVFQRPKITAREISQQLGITERSVLAIVADLDDAGYITRTGVAAKTSSKSPVATSFKIGPGMGRRWFWSGLHGVRNRGPVAGDVE